MLHLICLLPIKMYGQAKTLDLFYWKLVELNMLPPPPFTDENSILPTLPIVTEHKVYIKTKKSDHLF